MHYAYYCKDDQVHINIYRKAVHICSWIKILDIDTVLIDMAYNAKGTHEPVSSPMQAIHDLSTNPAHEYFPWNRRTKGGPIERNIQ